MSDTNIEVILKAISDLRESNTESHTAIKETVKAGIRGFQLKAEADAIVFNRQLKEMGHRITIVEGCEDQVLKKLLIFDRHVSIMKLIKKRWLVISLGIMALFTALTFLYDIGAITAILKHIFDKL